MSERFNYLQFLYGAAAATEINGRLQTLLNEYKPQLPPPADYTLSEQDSILITYGDMVQQPDERPLATLNRFLQEAIKGHISTVHLLPFYPFTSDDGFSVVDYKAVNPELGNWDDIAALSNHFDLMFDAVVNHISAKSSWFQAFLQDQEPYTDYFTVVDPTADLSAVFRPRALPLLTPFETPSGIKHVWTTFSDDQIDLNYANPAVLLEVIDVLLDYVAKGARFIRLDAIGFMWKEIGTSCIHLPQTHAAIQLMRTILDEVAPQVALITETNVPHQDNISYFGDGTNEAQMVYNFSLPPLTLHAFHTGSAAVLSKWAATLELPSDKVTFFNFLASHDGIGLTPARGILEPAEIEAMAARVEALNGRVSYKTNSDGSQSAYELNINYLAALGNPEKEETNEQRARRFLCAQALMLALRGVPGIYFHSLFGSDSWLEGVQLTGRNRTINREKLNYERLSAELADPDSLRHHVFYPYLQLLDQRSKQAAFHPNGRQIVLPVHDALFTVLRQDRAETSAVLCLHNVSDTAQTAVLDLTPYGFAEATFHPLLTDQPTLTPDNGRLTITIQPYEVIWLKAN
ncbi:MAG: hypothetical protein KDE51_20870 [Anaerolineales bacterium]|nr:hypothetical protein [Anaerolineales bacterium]